MESTIEQQVENILKGGSQKIPKFPEKVLKGKKYQLRNFYKDPVTGTYLGGNWEEVE